MAEKKASISPSSFTTFGSLMRYLRTRAELTQRDLAAKVGYHYSHVNRFEKDQRIPDRATLLARFVPALEIEDESEWINRLIELAEERHQEETKLPLPQTISLDEIYRVPTSLTSMIGREDEFKTLTKLLLQPDVRLVTILGPPGVGKTCIALHVAEKISGHFLDGAVFVNLMSLVNHELVLHTLAKSLGIIENSTASQIHILQNFLQNKNLLIVMDNFEQVVEAASQLPELLSSASSVKILVTSREALRVQAEREFPLKPLATPSRLQIADQNHLDDLPAVRLFVERASAIRPDFKLDQENASDVAEICRRLDGLPLAIELAAARIQTFQPAEMLEQFNRLFDWLTRGKRDTPTWRQTLLGAIEWSYELLSEAERLLLARLAVFSGGWTLNAAEIVCSDDSALKQNMILDLLSKLVDRSLVVAESFNGKTRYRCLDTIYHFAMSKLKDSDELTIVRSGHLQYFSEWTENIKDSLEQESPLELRSHMDIENDNICASLEFGLQSIASQEHALKLVYSAGRIWLRHSHFKEALEWIKKYITLFSAQDSIPPRLLYLATALSYWRDDVKQAAEYASKGLEAVKSENDAETRAGILYYLGDVHRELGDLETAKKSVAESINICKEEKLMLRLSMSLTSLAVILHQQRHLEGAQEKLVEALNIARQEKSLWAQSYALRVQADMLRYQGKFSEAFSAYEHALTISSEIDDRISMGMEFANISLVANMLDDYQASGYYAEKALLQFQTIGNEYQQPFPQRMLAYALIHENNLTEARVFCMESLKGNKSVGHETGLIACLICLAEILFTEGNISSAKSIIYAVVTEITERPLHLMEPDEKALEKLREELGIKQGIHIDQIKKISHVLTDFDLN